MREEFKRWWEQAEEDLDTAKANFDIKKYSYASFLCQQAVEKAIKALIIKKEGKIIKSHDLVVLGRKANLPDNLLNLCEKLTVVYIETRYPDVSKKIYTKEEAAEDINSANRILKWLGRKI